MSNVFDFTRVTVAAAGPSKGGREFNKLLGIHGVPALITKCPFCSSEIQHWIAIIRDAETNFADHEFHIIICGTCGWWRSSHLDIDDIQCVIIVHRIALLTQLSVSDETAPLAEIRRILRRDWRYAKEISAKKAEDLVASIFAEHLNCEIHYCSNGVFAKDGGIDFVLVNTEKGIEHAFQVKRRINSKAERVQPIREFIGSVSMSSYRSAYYVTTSNRFTSAATSEVEQSQAELASRDISVELVSGKRLHELLLQQRAKPATAEALSSQKYLSSDGWYRIHDPKLLLEMRMPDLVKELGKGHRAFDFQSVLAEIFKNDENINHY